MLITFNSSLTIQPMKSLTRIVVGFGSYDIILGDKSLGYRSKYLNTQSQPLLVRLGLRIIIMEYPDNVQIGASICPVLTADSAETRTFNCLFDSAKFHISHRESVLHGKQPCL